MWIFDLLDGLSHLGTNLKMAEEGNGKGCLFLFLEGLCLVAMMVCWAMGWKIPAVILTALVICFVVLEIREIWRHSKAKRAAYEEEKRKAQKDGT